jgi:hypothetical protein
MDEKNSKEGSNLGPLGCKRVSNHYINFSFENIFKKKIQALIIVWVHEKKFEFFFLLALYYIVL